MSTRDNDDAINRYSVEMSSPPSLHLNHQHHPSSSSANPPTASTGEVAGIYLGILNLFTTLPQFLGTAISAVVFSILEPGQSPELADGGQADSALAPVDGPNAIGVCLFIGALSTLVAAYATTRLRRV